jgi:pentose-5-phosphate-3-epimerase
MIQICPAILTDNAEDFTRQIKIYPTIFEQIDIDINIDSDGFKGMVTVDLPMIAEQSSDYASRLGFHLMVEKPEALVKELLSLKSEFKKSKFYIHQESSFTKEFLDSIPFENRCVAVQLESSTREVTFYSQFSEVQLMTVSIGFQGQKFEESALERAIWLKENGYKGKISIDGGIDLNSAKVIKNYPIDRVSVGSYFSKSENLELDKTKLNLALNIK